MAATTFDPYHKWLGIPPKEQPATHYRLLGINRFESDPEVIEAAANRQMTYLHELAGGSRVDEAQKLMGEVTAARICLLAPASKAEYDATLERESATPIVEPPRGPPIAVTGPIAVTANDIIRSTKPPRPTAAEPDAPMISTAPTSAPAGISIRQSSYPSTRRTKKRTGPAIIAAAMVLILVVCVGIAVAVFRGGEARDDGLAANAVATLPDGDKPLAAAPAIAPANDDSPFGDPEPAGPDRGNPVVNSPDNGKDDFEIPTPGADIPELIQKAQQALQEEDIPKMITHFEKYLAGNPQPRWEEEARLLVREGKIAISDEEAIKILRDIFDRKSDDEMREMYRAVQAGRNPGFGWPPHLSNPTMQKVLDAGLNKHLQNAFMARINKIGKPSGGDTVFDQQAMQLLRDMFKKMPDGQFQEFRRNAQAGQIPPITVPPVYPDPAKQQQLMAAIRNNLSKAVEERFNSAREKPAAGPEKLPEKQPDKPLAKPITDPAELLASKSLTREGNRWLLAKEVQLKEQLANIKGLESRFRKTRDSISERALALLRQKRAKLEADQDTAAKQWESMLSRGTVSGEEFNQHNLFKGEIKKLHDKVKAAEAKVSERDTAMNTMRSQLEQSTKEVKEGVQAIRDSYAGLAEDDQIAAAIEKLGGKLGPSALVQRAESAANHVNKMLEAR